MSVTSVNNAANALATGGVASAANTTKTSNSAAALDYNAFLKMLMAQMKNQDPTKPTDSTEWVSQLATFSNVEQNVQMNAKLGQILATQSLGNAEAMIGRTLTSADGSISGKVVSVQVTSGDPVATLENGASVTIAAGVRVS
jgi:flagellar basal-body rod modification protein FlgD